MPKEPSTTYTLLFVGENTHKGGSEIIWKEVQQTCDSRLNIYLPTSNF